MPRPGDLSFTRRRRQRYLAPCPPSDARTGHEASATAAARFAVSCGGRINNASCAGAREKIIYVPRGRFQRDSAGCVNGDGAATTNRRRTPRAWGTRSLRRRTRSRRRHHAGHGGQRRPLWYHLIALVVATVAPLISREAWATLQEWAVCSSIFVVGRGVKAGLPGSTLRGTLNARSKRVARSRRPSGRRTAYICAASSAAALVVPRPQRCPAVASLKQLWRKRRRQHRAAGGLVASMR